MKRYIKLISIFTLIFSLCLLNINFNVKADDSHSHSYNNGICECGEYEEPIWKQHYPVGWKVGNAGQLLYVIEKHNSGELNNNIIITNDITLPEDFEFVPLGTAEYPFTKSILTINDNVYTINLNNQVVTSSNYGFIGYAKGEETNKALIENIKIKGNFDISATCENVAGLVGVAENNVTIKNSTSEVNINVLENGIASTNVAGILGKGIGKVNIEACSNFGTINAAGVYSYVGGIAACVDAGDIIASANYANITAPDAKYVGGIVGYVDNENFQGIKSNLNIGSITGKTFEITINGTKYQLTPGEIAGYLGKHVTSSVSNNYYTFDNPFGVVIYKDLNPLAAKASKENLENGYITYKLGTKFGQKLDKLEEGETKELYPMIASLPVYEVLSCDGSKRSYSNINENAPHIYKYSLDGNIIYQTCENCNLKRKVELLAPENLNYDKTLKEARLSSDIEGIDLNSIEITYNAEVIYPGKYTAKFTYQGLTATLEFEVKKGIPTASMFTYHPLESDLVYDGTAKKLNLYSTDEYGMGEIVLSYSHNGNTLTEIINGGYYLVNVSVLEGKCYEAYTFNALDLFSMIEIKPKEITVEWTNTTLYYEEGVNIYTPEFKYIGTYYNEKPTPSFSNIGTKRGTFTTTISCVSDNYVLVGDNLTVEFTVKGILVTPPEIIGVVKKEGQTQKPDVQDTSLYRVVENNGGINYGKYRVILELIDPTNYTWGTTEDSQITLDFYIYMHDTEWTKYPTIKDWEYGKPHIRPEYAVSNSYLDIKIEYRHINGEFSTAIPTEVGEYEVRLTSEINDLRAAPLEEVILKFRINKTNPLCSIESIINVDYGTRLSDIELIGNGDGTWSYKNPEDKLLPVGSNSVELIFTPTNPHIYNTITKVITINVNPLEVSYASPKAVTNLVYNNTLQALVIPGSAINGTMYYKINDGEWSQNIPLAENAGTYTVYYKVVANKNYVDVAEKSIQITIKKVNLTINVDNISVEQYTVMPKFTYTLEGLIIGDELENEPTISAEIDNTNTVGTYVLSILDVVSPNYNITYNNGTLTITEHIHHQGGNATCTQKAVCEICNSEYGDLAEHLFNDYQYQDDKFSSKCEHCDEIDIVDMKNSSNNLSNDSSKLWLGILIGSVSVLCIGALLYFFIVKKKKIN